ncbi:MAG: fused MFS/spermidine synthase [Pseudomonadota bacterium]
MTSAGSARSSGGVWLSLWLGLLFTAASQPVTAEVVHRERSLYQTVIVVKESDRVCMQFTVRRDQRNQTCFYPKRPREMVFPYTRMMMTVLTLNPNPQRMLVLGLGGGTLPGALMELYPQATMDVVEIDPVVVEVAEQWFNYLPGPNTTIHVQDARVFVKRELKRLQTSTERKPYDIVLLDAFNGDYIPEHLMTREFLEEVRGLLSETGVIAANTFAASRLYDHESATYAAVFGSFLSLAREYSGNRILFTRRNGLSVDVKATARVQAAALEERVLPYGIDLPAQVNDLTARRDWDTSARVLTDQFSPANLLREKRRRPGP